MKIVTTPEGVFSLTKAILASIRTTDESRESYLQSLVATTQRELGSERRARAGAKPKLDEAGIATQLAALHAVHDRFYEAVLRACSENLPGPRLRAAELNRRSNFARTALSAARRWIRSGRDITGLVPERVTKASLAVKSEPREPSAKVITTRVERGITELITDVQALATKDKAAAVNALQSALNQITTSLAALSGSATRDPVQAMVQHRPFRTRSGVFFPVGAAAAA